MWTAWGGRSTPEAHLSDLQRELNLETLINRQEWLGFTSPQQAYAWRTNELNQRKQMNYAEWAGYQTADQYLSYLQKERSELSDLNTVLLRRSDIYKANADAALGYANALQGTHKSAGQIGEGIDLSGVQQFSTALVSLPDTVTTTLAVDDSGALAELAKYEALLRGVPRSETTSTTDVITAAYAMGGRPVPSALPKAETIPVSFTGPWQEQFGQILAEVARLHELRVQVPVDFRDDAALAKIAAFSASLKKLGATEVLQQLVNVHVAPGGGGGPPGDPGNVSFTSLPPPQSAAAWTALSDAEAMSAIKAHLAAQGQIEAGAGAAKAAAGVDSLAAAWGKLSSAEVKASAAAGSFVPLPGGAGGGGGGGAPPPVAPAAGAEPPDGAAGKWLALATAEKAEAAATGDAGGAARAAVPKLDSLGGSATRLYGWWGALRKEVTLFGGLFGSTALIGSVALWHVALDGIIEALAVLIPAVVTATAGLLGWGAAAYQSGQQVYNQMKNVLTVSSALNTTVPPLTGHFQQLVDAVRPQVWQLFGDALDLANGKTGVFQGLVMQTGRVLDQFGARLVVDMQRGGQGMQTFFDTGAKALAMLGQILVNIGHAVANLIKATEITHIAEDLLAVVTVLSKLFDIITKLPAPLLAAVLGLHGLALWGGLAVSGVTKLALGMVSMLSAAGPLNGVMATLAEKLGASDKQLVSIAGHSPAVKAVADAMGQNAAQISQFAVAAGKGDKSVQELAISTERGAGLAEKYGAGLGKAGQEAVSLAIAAGATEQQVARVASGFANAGAEGGFLAGLLAKVGGAAGLATAGVGALAAAAVVFAVLALRAKDSSQQWIDSMNKGLASQSLFTVIGKNMADLAAVTQQLTGAQGLNAQSVHELAGAQSELSASQGLMLSRVGQVSKAYGVGMVGALELLHTAGVKTSDLFTRQGLVWATDLQMVKGLVDGYKAMGQQLGTVGSDLNVLLVSESDQLKSMQTLNKAWDAFQQLVAGSFSGVIKVAGDLRQFATDAGAAGASMTGLGASALTLQKDFQGTYTDVETLFSAFRAAQAVDGGAGNFTRFVKDAVAALIPLAGQNKAAAAEISQLAQEAGGPATTNLKQLALWSGNVKDPMTALYKAAQQATVASSNLSADAAQLTNTLQADLNPALARAAFDAEGGQKALSGFADDLLKLGPGSQATVAAGRQVADMFLSIDKNSGQAKAQFTGWVESMGYSRAQANTLWAEVSKGARPLADMRSGLSSSATASDNLAKSGFFAQRGDAFRANMRNMADWFTVTLPHAIGTAASALAGAGKDVGSFFASAGREGASFFAGLGRDVAGFAGSTWAKAWQNVAAPAIRAFTDIEHFVTSSFDTWWKSHGAEVEQVWHSVTASLTQWWDNFTGGLERAWSAVVSWFKGNGDVSKTVRAGFDSLLTSLKPVIDAVEGLFRLAWSVIEAGGKTAWDVIAAAGKTAWDALMAVLKTAWAALVATVKTAWDLGVGVLKAVWDAFVGVINVTLDVITGHWSKAWHDMQATWNQVNNAISTAFQQTWNNIWGFLKVGWNNFSGFFKQLWNNSIDLLRQLWNTWWGWFDRVIIGNFRAFFTRTVPGWFNDFTNFAKNSWNDSWHSFDNVIIGNLRHFFTSTVPGWWNDFERFAGNAASGVSRAIVAAFKSALGTADRVINTPINFINNDILKHLPGGIHIPTLPVSFASGGAMRYSGPGSVPGTGDEDGTHIVAMGGEYMVRKPARMALESAYGRGFMNMLNQADTWLAAGSRGSPAAQQRRPGVNYAMGGEVHLASGGAYQNPLRSISGLRPERIDMGVDYAGSGPLYAVGPGRITNTRNSGWPGGAFISELLAGGQYAGMNVYMAENITPLVTPGMAVTSDTRIGHLNPAFPNMEIGWATPDGHGETMAAAAHQQSPSGDPGSRPTAYGVSMSNFLRSLGAPGGILSGQPSGSVNAVLNPVSVWQAVEGLLNSAGNALGDLVKPLAQWVSGGAGELLKLAEQGSRDIFDAIWGHAVQPMVDVVPGDTIPGAVGRYGAAQIKAGIDSFLGAKDQAAQQQAVAANASTGSVGPVSGPADAGPGQAENYAKGRLSAFGWGPGEFPPLQSLWTRESGWNRFARNSSSGAYGIPQALPPTKLPAAGQAGGGSHASPQIDWGMGYIKSTPGYGSPAAAWAHELAHGWYPHGGVVGGDGADLMPVPGMASGGTPPPPPLPVPAAFMASGGLAGWGPLDTAVRSEMSAMNAMQAAKLPSQATSAQRGAFSSWLKALWGQQLKTVGLGRTPPGAYQALASSSASPARMTGGQWSAFTGDLTQLTKEEEGTGVAGGINPPGTPASSGYAAWRYLRPQWQALLDRLRIAGTRAGAAQTQWGSQFSVTPAGPGSSGQTGTDSPEWDAASAGMNTAVRTEMDAMQAMQGAHLPSGAVPTMTQRHAYTDWLKALWGQQLKTVGLGRVPPGAYQAISDRLTAPGTITAGQWSAFTGDLSYLTREEEGPGAGGINPPGTPANSGWAPWKYLHGDWQALLSSMRNAQAKTTAARTVWGSLYGPGHLPSTPGPGKPPHATPVPSGLVNVMPEATMGGPGHPVSGAPPMVTPDMGFAAGGGLGQVAGMFSGGLDPGGVMIPVVARHGIPDSVLRLLSGAGSSAGPREYPRRLSEAGGSHFGPALNVEQLNISNPLPQRPSDSIAHAANRLAFLGGRMN